VPFERYGVFVVLVSRMVFGDMMTWIVIVIPFVLGLTTAANAVSMGATEAPFVGEGGHSLAFWPYALESFALMFTNGVTPGFRVYTYEDHALVDQGGMGVDTTDQGEEGVDTYDQGEEGVVARLLAVKKRTDGMEKEDMDYPSQLTLDENYNPTLGFFFYFFYMSFCYIVLVMLLNLLIAMMGNTYASAMEQATLEWRAEFARLILKMELNLFNTPIPPWVPGAAKRKHLTERLTKLGAEIPDEGEKRYYGFQSYTVNEGMQLHGTLDDIFKDAPKIEEDERAEDHAEEMSELAGVAANVRQCQSQLSQLIRLQGGREQAPAANGTHASSPDRRAREDHPRRSSSGKAPSEGESDGEGAGKKVKPKKRRPRSIVAPPGGVGPPGGVAPPDGVEPTWRLHVT